MPVLPLHPRHIEKGARFSPYGEWELPADYGDPLLEYFAVRKGVGIADLSYQGTFLLTGRDRIPFLQNLISNDLTKTPEGKGIYATLLTAKGRIVSDFHLFPLSDAILIDLEGSNAKRTFDHLMRFKLRSQIKIETPPWGRLMISGPKGRLLLETILGILPGSLPAMEENSFFQTKRDGASLLCVKRSMTGEDDHHLFLPLEGMAKMWEDLFTSGEPFEAKPVGQSALETLRIEAGKPRYGIDLSEEVFPVEAGIDAETISYTKGCYPGQEVMARIQTYGHVNRRLTGLILEGTVLPKIEAKIFQGGNEVGWITGTTWSPSLQKGIAMGYLKVGSATPGTAVEVEIDHERKAAQVTSLPFYHSKPS